MEVDRWAERGIDIDEEVKHITVLLPPDAIIYPFHPFFDCANTYPESIGLVISWASLNVYK